jgi:hypothetical protein
MKSVSFTDFRANASALFDEVERGETVIVLRHGTARPSPRFIRWPPLPGKRLPGNDRAVG